MDSAARLRDAVREKLSRRTELPSLHPTASAWQEPQHPRVATAQSLTLPEQTDVAIIGSGITGCAVAYALLHNDSAAALNLRVTVLEARTAVSGATGRNGGHLVSDADSIFSELVLEYGEEQAVEILRFSEANIARLRALVEELDPEDCVAAELRSVIATIGFADSDMFEKAKQDMKSISAIVPERTLKFKIRTKEEAEKAYKYRNIVGAVEQHGAAALWPYRLFTAIFDMLLRKFEMRFTLETNTAVTQITHDDSDDHYPYALKTIRGIIRTKKIIHCTNGYSAYLTPSLNGKLWPLRGTMSVQEPASSFPQLGSEVSWTPFNKSRYDPETEAFSSGLYYAQQNCTTGHIWIGGEVQKLEDLLSSDDSKVSDMAKANILSIPPKAWNDIEPLGSSRVWSGIMGFTADGLPYIGKLTPKITEREGDGEWIAAGFNGHGMDKCWLSGEAVARMVLDDEIPNFLPKAYILDECRFNRASIEVSTKTFLGNFC